MKISDIRKAKSSKVVRPIRSKGAKKRDTRSSAEYHKVCTTFKEATAKWLIQADSRCTRKGTTYDSIKETVASHLDWIGEQILEQIQRDLGMLDE